MTIDLTSEPSGATIFVGSDRRGTTPTTLTLPRGDRPIAIRLERTGSKSATIALAVDRDGARSVKLAPRKKKAGGRGDDETFTNPFAK